MLLLMRRVTLALDDDLLRTLKARAAQEGRTLSRLANDLLRQAQLGPTRPMHRPKWRTFAGKGALPGVDIDDRKSLYDAMEGKDGNGA
jgi:plasmid stability protein